MSLSTRLDRLERTVIPQDCSANHDAVHVSHVGIAGIETADPEPDPCSTCGGTLDVVRVVITTVPDRGERP